MKKINTKIMVASASIVSAMIDRSRNDYSVDEVIKMTTDIYNGITEPKQKEDGAKAEAVNPLFENKPNLGIKPTVAATVTPDHLISLEDGKPYKSLRRHLSKHGLTPEQYRERWNLPSDYPMISENYSARRKEIAEKIGLGRNNSAKKRKPLKAVKAA